VGFSGKDLILLAGGIFLIYKATKEIHHKLEGDTGEVSTKVAPTLVAVIGQVLLLDMVFSIDSVITAVGMTTYVWVMVIAIVMAVFVMLLASKAIYTFVNTHPSVKMLALAFLLLIGTTLIAEGFGQKIPKGYIYASMTFSIFVEVLNIRAQIKKKQVDPIRLRESIVSDEA
jgi:predicted tellurium resistance membrane protein TerC